MHAKAKLLRRIKRVLEQYKQEHRCGRVTLVVSQFSPLDGMPGDAVFREVPWQSTSTVFVAVPCPQEEHLRKLYRAFLVMLACLRSGRAQLTDHELTSGATLCSATEAELLAAGIPPDFAAEFVALGNRWRDVGALSKPR